MKSTACKGESSSPSTHDFAHFYEGPWPKLSQPLVVLAPFSAHQDLQSSMPCQRLYLHSESTHDTLMKKLPMRSVRGRTSEPMAERFCHVAQLLAEHLPLCGSNRESRQSASFHKLPFCRRLLSMSEKRGKT